VRSTVPESVAFSKKGRVEVTIRLDKDTHPYGPRALAICLAAGLALAILVACHREARISTHVLFIGNSYTYFNGGLDKQLEGLAPSVDASSLAFGGYTLERHWTDGRALDAIRRRRWDYVVLQEQSQTPVVDQQKFYEYTRAFDREIRASGAKTVLLMTWERPDSVTYGVTTSALAAAYSSIGSELGARVAPAGLAFARSLQKRPDLALYGRDGHPTVAGTYLAACVLYETILGRDPVGDPYSDPGIRGPTRDYLQRIAAESLGK
jgi:hypothetical protein